MWNRCGNRPPRSLRICSTICCASDESTSGYSTRAMVDTVSRRLTNVPSALMDIVIPDDYPPTYANLEQPDLQRLAPYGAVRLYTSRAADRDELFARLSSAEVVINVRAYTALDEEAFAHAPALRMISILGTGTDNVDLAAAARRGITVTNTPAVGAPSVAELTLGLILAVVRAIPVSDARVRE